ncbi:magnesium transporter [Austwickia chelonae]|uniref:Magnesium transport protein CorA n=1 Tax=Austwickia chelonae NBRC 105200 TaxID=1184607 RepID=K6ULC7_9MICO|nr:magnesium/cobalt transporter CorA [Austwickia chelonae]GAB77136.1 magnesium transport protein CorA [Austwickia chelonae NBRC 105200]SEW03548.1 magnesium transporter [Austwickia chelonae]
MIVDKAVYRDGVRYECGDPSDELEELRASGTSDFLWIGLKDPTDEEFAEYDDELSLHPLAVEDALHGNQRPKVDIYETSTFVVLKTLRYIERTSDVETGELMMFVGDRFVLTVRYGEANPLAGVRQRLEGRPERLSFGPVAVMHAVIDHIVDTYRTIDVELERDLEDIEEAVFAHDEAALGTQIYKLKREILEFKRGALPLVTPMRNLLGSEASFVPTELRPFFADVLDHLVQVCEHAESYDRLLGDIFSTHLAQQGLRQNEDMRRISAWVAIAAVPTMIAGIYGMNFKNMPELETHYGYHIVVAVMILSCLLMYIRFRRAKWL